MHFAHKLKYRPWWIPERTLLHGLLIRATSLLLYLGVCGQRESLDDTDIPSAMENHSKRTFRIRAQPKAEPQEFKLAIDVADDRPPLMMVYRNDKSPFTSAVDFCVHEKIDMDLVDRIADVIKSVTGGRYNIPEVKAEEVVERPQLPSSLAALGYDSNNAGDEAEESSGTNINASGKNASGCCGGGSLPKVYRNSTPNPNNQSTRPHGFTANPQPKSDEEAASTTRIWTKINKTLLETEVRVGDLESTWEKMDVSRTNFGHEARIKALEKMITKLVKENVALSARVAGSGGVVVARTTDESLGE